MPEPSEPRQRPYVWAVRLPDLVHIKMWFMKCGAQQQASVFSRRTKLLRWRLTCFQLGSIPDQGKFFIYIFVLAFNFLRLFFSLNRFFTKKKSICFKVHGGNLIININNIHRALSLRQPGPRLQTLAISGKGHLWYWRVDCKQDIVFIA